MGVLALDGSAPSGWKAWLCPPETDCFDHRDEWPTATLDPDGRFDLVAREPGSYRLVVGLTGEKNERVFIDNVQLGDTPLAWERRYPTGTLVLEGLDAADVGQDTRGLLYLWEGADGVRYLGRVVPDQDGLSRLDAVPAGKGRLVHPTSDSPATLQDWDVVAAAEILEGQETQITVP